MTVRPLCSVELGVVHDSARALQLHNHVCLSSRLLDLELDPGELNDYASHSRYADVVDDL
ncbi:hypothetical protein CH253_15840 [Rhodococcus sp. 06-156-3C]|uniref:hypothetical protein n=1 Tax=Nocardiaceae TaxID=85025 RepID=UPI000522F27A|nr:MULTISPECIES: hypothetical protein [Rhodococcus]OZD19320.1 hypothetical protein CH253_15840 [Rhodococcus sp. 06-156-3C]OZD21655.1 hypothetical protein CH280_01755 [Rhodococcus sp. 06-156-4C]OZD25340.1 hypothetical protein CH248_04625 [Rhodococcus sp. 06-156-4a]OZD33045.1 hypothetical protein CH247_10235 [Rhodococcus sp. 06-156-3b]OZD41879.1 hypothetical protein CH284_00445 [Rhodococcus sp. 06-156-3]